MTRLLPCLAAVLLIGAAPAPMSARPAAPEVWVTFEADSANAVQQAFAARGLAQPPIVETRYGIAVSRLREDQLDVLSGVMHERYHRCPGFISHPSREEALLSIERSFASPPEEDLTSLYVIDNAATVNTIMSVLSAARIEQTIVSLSSFPTRRYTTQDGANAAAWLRDTWRALPLGRYGATAEYYTHSWLQPSVILTIPGARFPDQVVVMGAHLDSISSNPAAAPGADDDASGVATLTEVIRAAMNVGYRPDRTVKIMAYAGEESGLLGSRAIAAAHRAANVNVVGVLQLDMTNFKGTPHADVALITDPEWTNGAQNEFLKALINTYTGLPWIGTECNYACSDHVAWDENGYRVSFPFEASFQDYNQAIHSPNDTLATSGGNAEHSLKFAKVAAAYLAEMAKGRIGSPPTVPEATAPTLGATSAR